MKTGRVISTKYTLLKSSQLGNFTALQVNGIVKPLVETILGLRRELKALLRRIKLILSLYSLIQMIAGLTIHSIEFPLPKRHRLLLV